MYRAGFKKLKNLEGDANFTANKTYTYRIRLEPHMSIDPHKSFFSAVDSVARVGDRVDADLAANFDAITSAKATQIRVRSDNHIMNLIGTFRMLINGTVVEEYTGEIGEIDTILKRLNCPDSYNVIKDHANVGKTYEERYLDCDITQRDYQVTPDFSKFWRLTDVIVGGIDLQFEITIHRDYHKRALYTGFGSDTFIRANNTTAISGATQAADIYTETALAPTDYVLDSLDLYVWVEENKILAPTLQPQVYSHSSWKLERRTLTNATKDFNFEFFLQKGLKSFGFVFHTNTPGYSAQIQPNDFTGCPLFTRGSPANAVTNEGFRVANSQALQLINYEIEYGKNKLPYNTFTQELVTASKNFTRGQAYINQINYGKTFDMAGSIKNNDFSKAHGPIYFEVFRHNDNDQNVLRLKLTFSANVSNLDMYYFYEYETQTVLNYDATGNCVQVVPSF